MQFNDLTVPCRMCIMLVAGAAGKTKDWAGCLGISVERA
jgi:hypothetical protein